jgi:hypothetical protein
MANQILRRFCFLCLLGGAAGLAMGQTNPLNMFPAQPPGKASNQTPGSASKNPAAGASQTAPGTSNTTPPTADGSQTSVTGSTQSGNAATDTARLTPLQTITSDAFGANLFLPAHFTRQGPLQFNPNYTVSTGDSIQVRLWGVIYLLMRNWSLTPRAISSFPMWGRYSYWA